MRVPRHVSPAAARRRSLLVDALLGVAIGICAIVIAAGIGVVGFFAFLVILIIAPWYLLEGGLRSARRRRGSTRSGRGRPRVGSRGADAGEDRDRRHHRQLDAERRGDAQ